MDHYKLLADASFTFETIGVKPGTDEGVSTAEKIISNVIGLLTFAAVIYFVVQIILAGYAFISSDGDEKKMEGARSRLTTGILGLTIVVLALGLGSLLATILGLQNIFSLNSVINTLKFQ